MLLDTPAAPEASGSTVADSAFDAHGRCIPAGLHAPAHVRSRRYFHLVQPDVDYAAALARLQTHLGAGLGLNSASFRSRSEAILRRLLADPATAGLARGVAVPFVLPGRADTDLGADLEARVLPAVGAAFTQRFPDYSFTNHHKTGLGGKLSVLPGSRHQQVLAAPADTVGLYFPMALAEFSVPAAVEQLAGLPQHLLLSGVMDVAAALVACPELLQRGDGYPPLLWLGGVAGEKDSIAYHFEAYGYNLTFNRRAHLGQAAEYWANGITVLESA